MPRTQKVYNKQVNVSLSEKEYKDWSQYYQANKFSSLSHMVRFVVNSYLDGTLTTSNNTPVSDEFYNKLDKKTESLEQQLKEILLNQETILKKVINGVSKTQATKQITLQTKLLELIEQKPRTLVELVDITGMDEREVIGRLNALIESDRITTDKEFHYKVF